MRDVADDSAREVHQVAVGILGGVEQSVEAIADAEDFPTALAALPDGRALFIYNQRKHGEPGVYLAVARPTETDFGVEANEIVWRAQTKTQSGSSGEHTEWQDFAFGEPHVLPLPDGTLLVTLWCVQPAGQGIRWVKLRMT